ncbi:recombinase family protein [Vibrio parahaemolyticus]|nr:recombinase family protein [Vibrio parahaemolyticus]ELB2121775.1 recombinase family protein [Vibrio parahaemolyticus]MDF4503784.1 recombinase family protein [Vibrio parahaemolyticus]MDG3428591.1 recombinase family protein [Vibrio parahaemolyticus]
MSGQQIGYKRVSSFEQITDRQLADVELDKIFEEKCSASTIQRDIWQQCLNYVRSGDTLHIHSLDRVCRSGAGDAVSIVEQLIKKGVSVKFHKEGLEFYGQITAAQKGVLGILASVAQMERELIRERQAEGIAAAKEKGKKFGRPKTSVNAEQIDNLKSQGISMTEIARQLGVGRATLYKVLKQKVST